MTVSERLLHFLAKLSRRSDLVIAILMLVAVVMMLIPLPTFLVDILITANIAVSVLILLVSFYVSHPLQFSSLPSVILIATLFRLAITITTTRLILLQADAGEIVSAFGTFVVGGSIAVGLVIFLIITVAQFIVVARGAERVAEVAARFTLDALPGKQMSIDAELRNGDIDQAEARRLRQQLERESQLFGAMDGAMKFVKGDVIAGIVIILVNLIGGFAIGTLQHDMSLGDAAVTYSLLTVGDGLVAQIPALLVAVAAGTMVTRVGNSDGTSDLGRQITSQLLRDSRALALAAVIMVGLAVVPGFPSLVFLILGACFGAGAYAINRRTARESELKDIGQSGMAEQPGNPALSATPVRTLPSSSRIVVRFGTELGRSIPEPEFARLADGVRRELFGDLGVDVPAIGLQVDEMLSARGMRIDLEGAPILDAEIPADRVLVEADPTNLDLLDVTYEKGSPIAGQRKFMWVDDRHISALKEAGFVFSAPAQTAAKWTGNALRLYAGHFVGIQETRRLLSDMEPDYADLVRQAQEIVPLQKIAEVLRRLVGENVPIRNLRLILEALIEWGQREQDVVMLTECIRTSLKRQISFRFAGRSNIIAAYVLQRSAEDILRNAVQSTSTGTFLNLSDDAAQALVTEIERALSQHATDVSPVVLAAMDVRRHMRSLLTHNAIELPVLSFQELAQEFNVQPLAAIAGCSGMARNASQSLPSAAAKAGQEAAS
ncbi:MAG: EscV/YscV/HrcV family type III secretion system export apparatus protein [Mesorhizobium sp.]|uniref:type III secretion system export apparatus subunit SctV n=1 Tax=Mesorhizobium sp. TaxID=1871066 RepID=UPI000FE84965|nr:type III secretion system export apparatus subunit SctV [Mesorhizobium sp.]RWH84588.1 MAG: EscV/YscV/HrcV family type III secretion system export apparatus protein [Mesorhizobium sp.]RWH86977.1 MAG: EscV/YscV/HrcV family type III secretion system export apparatus protein [Mesorhizobium sp.]RWH93486.1 MAG: EscV/YscV/HrcV family type III secretion system export apparatus protein [Mesorhizobium sp.]RWI03058.1 MAG: EscV/YscV/HrcV family type III secretion system export apparatus protein [Mesorhi